jgi:hypothetical protein
MGVLGLHVCMVISSSALHAVDTGPGYKGLHLLVIIEHTDGHTALPDHFVKGGHHSYRLDSSYRVMS